MNKTTRCIENGILYRIKYKIKFNRDIIRIKYTSKDRINLYKVYNLFSKSENIYLLILFPSD